MKKLAYGSVALAAVFGLSLFAACAPQEVAVESVTLSSTELSLKVGETETLTATVLPEDATEKTVTWSSSEAAVASVEDGTVTALAEGEAVITAACGEVSAVCSVTVTPAYAPVTQEEWEEAFSFDGRDDYGVDAHLIVPEEEIDQDIIRYVRTGGLEYLWSGIEGEIEGYTQKTDTGYIGYAMAEGIWTIDRTIEDSFYEMGNSPIANFLGSKGVLGNLIGAYDQMKDGYDEEEEGYRGTVTIEGASASVAAWFAEGKLRRLILSAEGATYDMTFTYAGLSVTLPEPLAPAAQESAQVTQEQWEAAFALDEQENFSMTCGIALYDGDVLQQFSPAYCEYFRGEGEELLRMLGGSSVCSRARDGKWDLYYLQTEDEESWVYGETSEDSVFMSEPGILFVSIAGQTPEYDAERGCYPVDVPEIDEDAEGEVYFGEDGTLRAIVVTIPPSDSSTEETQYVFNLAYGVQGDFPDLEAQSTVSAEDMAAAFDVMASGNFLMTVTKTEADVDTTVVTCTVADGKADIYQNFNGSERVYAQQMTDGTWQIYEWTTDGWGAQDEPVASLFAYCGVETLIGLAAVAELTYDDVLLCYHGTVMMDTAELNVTVYFQGGRVSSIRFASADGEQAAVLSFVYGGQWVSLPFEG